MTYYRVGKIVNTHGIRGQVKVIADTDFPEERFAPGQTLYIMDETGQIKTEVVVESSQVHKGTYLIQFSHLNNINLVECYKGDWLAIASSSQQDLPEDEFYHHQIIGLQVVTDTGEQLGNIKEILQLGSNDVWVVKRQEAGKKDALIPYIDEIVKQVDLKKGQVVISLMEGLIDDED